MGHKGKKKRQPCLFFPLNRTRQKQTTWVELFKSNFKNLVTFTISMTLFLRISDSKLCDGLRYTVVNKKDNPIVLT